MALICAGSGCLGLFGAVWHRLFGVVLRCWVFVGRCLALFSVLFGVVWRSLVLFGVFFLRIVRHESVWH